MEPVDQFWMVVGRTAHGRLTGHPTVAHDTLAKAEAEALRLAAKDPGTTFFALAAVYAALAQKPTAQPVPIRGAIPEAEDIIDYMEAKAAASIPADDWIEWRGGLCPVFPAVRVKVRFADGSTNHNHFDAAGFSWARTGGPGDIVAYRVVRT